MSLVWDIQQTEVLLDVLGDLLELHGKFCIWINVSNWYKNVLQFWLSYKKNVTVSCVGSDLLSELALSTAKDGSRYGGYLPIFIE